MYRLCTSHTPKAGVRQCVLVGKNWFLHTRCTMDVNVVIEFVYGAEIRLGLFDFVQDPMGLLNVLK